MNVRLLDGRTADVEIDDGRIQSAVAATHRPMHVGALDLTGHLLLPAPAEPHAHLDKVLTADFLLNRQGNLEGAVAAWYGYRGQVTRADLLDRASRAIALLTGNGATAIRTHMDVGEATGCRLVEPMLELRARYESVCDLEVVAMVDTPVTGAAGTANRAQLRAALEAGADAVGGAPYRDPDPIGCQRLLLELAAEYDVLTDLHTDETLDPEVLSLRSLPEDVLATGRTGRVVASHCVSLSVQAPKVAGAVAADLARAGVAVVACPATNLYLQARGSGMPLRGLTAVAALRAAGVVVAGGGDNVADPFYPLGCGDPFETAGLLVSAGHLTPEQAYAAVSTGARRAMGLPDVEVRPGSVAELIAVRADSVRAAIAGPRPAPIVIHRGRLVGSPLATAS